VSVNDVLLSCVAGALRRYLAGKGDDTRGMEIRAMVPVNLRPANESPRLGNRFGLVPLVLPVGLANPLERLYDVRRRMDELKGGYQAPLAYALLSVIGQAPRVLQSGILDYLASKSTAVMTNVPGPAEPIRIAGNTVQRVMFWVPQSSDIGMGVSILSYRGGVQFGVMTDSKLCPQPQQIIDGFAPEFERLLLTLALLPRDLLAGGPLIRANSNIGCAGRDRWRPRGRDDTFRCARVLFGAPAAAGARGPNGFARTTRSMR
jgi:WS/DGAT/MGAT family acyltransferase